MKLLLLISFVFCAYSAQGQQPVQLPDDLRSKVDSVLSQFSRGREIQNEIKQKFGKIPLVVDDKDLEKGVDGSVLFFFNKPAIFVRSSLSPEMLAEIISHEYEHYKDLRSYEDYQDQIFRIGESQIVPTKNCLKAEKLNLCIRRFGRVNTMFPIIGVIYTETKAYNSQIKIRNEGLRAEKYDIVGSNGKHSDLTAEVLPHFINVNYVKGKLGVDISDDEVSRIMKASMIYPSQLSLYAAYFTEAGLPADGRSPLAAR